MNSILGCCVSLEGLVGEALGVVEVSYLANLRDAEVTGVGDGRVVADCFEGNS